ncbi:hypothetical protein B0H14DRAFT_2783637 [Mycena olivaceomarginata]|nr:hypothetical protein B0H14DRAFT_2783637 [Mycena olivaceomarginata]
MFRTATPPPENPSREDIIWLAGPRLIGLVFNWGLLGVLTTQVYIYHINFPKDRRFLKAIVYIVYVLDWIQTCSATYDAFSGGYMAGDPFLPSMDCFTGFLNVPILSSIIGAIVQIFFGWRIWALSKSKITFAGVIFLSLLQLGGGASQVTRSVGLVRAVGIRLAGSAAVDTVIAVSMTYFLVHSRGRTLSHTSAVLTRLVRLTIETGTVTALAAVADLIFFVRAHNGLHQPTRFWCCSTTVWRRRAKRMCTKLGPSSFQNAGRTRSAPSDLDVEWNLQASVNSMEMKSYLRNGNEEQGERTR